MKIATITCHRAFNYGAVLQAYALEKFLEKDKNQVEVIDYYPKDLHKTESKSMLVKLIRPIIRTFDFKKSQKVFGKFLQENMKLTKQRYHNLQELEEKVPDADIFIVGSDQVWNCNTKNGNDDSFFLTFVPENKRKVSYAASIAMDELTPEQEKRFYKNLKSFDKISVREKTAIKLLKKCGMEQVQKVLDPVYLLEKQDWDELAKKSEKKLEQEKYILVYGFKRQKNLYEYARKLAKQRNCKIYSINTNIEDKFLDVDKYFWNASPEDFVNLVKNAQEVVTNSFHGLSFSIIYQKPVHQFTKVGKENSRMLDLLDELSLSSRLVKDSNTLLDRDINFEEANKKIKEHRNQSMEFLRDLYR